MARSHAIWVVLNELEPRWPVAAFTVKHELVKWLENLAPPQTVWLHVWRCENPLFNVGGNAHILAEQKLPEEVDINELLGIPR